MHVICGPAVAVHGQRTPKERGHGTYLAAPQQLEESATLAVSAKAAKMKAEGIDVVSFGAGEPDFDTPDHIKQAAYDAIKKGMTKYATPASTAAAKEAVVERFKKENNLDYKPGQVILTRRRQGGPLPGDHGPDGPRRRVHHPRALLGQLPRDGQARPGPERLHRGQGGERLQAHPRPDRREDHEEDQAVRLQQPVQPRRLHLHPG